MKRSWVFFFLSLATFSFVFFLVRHFMTSLDEYDNITAPYLMSQGLKFYTDQFNMHFPFPYYWAYLFSPLWLTLNFSRAIAFFRLSLLIIYLICYFAVSLSFKQNSHRVLFSVWILLSSLLLPLYHGNLYLSDTFFTIFASSIFWLVIPTLFNNQKFSNFQLFLSVVFASLGFWSQPFLGILFLIPLFFITRQQISKYILIAFLTNVIPLSLLLFNSQFSSFFDQTVVFNFTTYSKYFPEQIGNYSMMFQNLLVFIPHEILLFTSLSDPFSIFQFIVHLCLIFFTLYLLFHKKYKYFFLLLLIIAATRLREIKINPSQMYNYAFFPFISIASSSALILFTLFKNKFLKVLSLASIVLLFFTAAISFSPIFSQSIKSGYNYDVFWSYRQRMGEDIASLTNPSDKILIYPYDSDLYFFSKRLPFDNYIYWYPWVNRVDQYRQQRMSNLKSNPPVLIYYGNMSYRDNPHEYASFFPDLLTNYRQVFHNCQPTNYYLISSSQKPLPAGFSFNCQKP